MQGMNQEYSLSLEAGADLSALHAKIAELERQNAELAEKERLAREEAELLQAAIDALPRTLFIKDLRCIYLGCSQLFADHAGIPHPRDIKGKNDYQFLSSREQADAFRADDFAVMKSGQAVIDKLEPLTLPGGRTLWPYPGTGGLGFGIIHAALAHL